jgi:hypothetical protein
MLRKFSLLSLALAALALVYVVGCNNSDSQEPQAGSTDKPQEAKTTARVNDGEHEHKPGAHGGIMVEIGRDNYHAEAVFEKGGTVRLYTLGNDEAKVQEVESQVLTAYVKPEAGTESISVLFMAEPQAGDAEGKTSQFVGKLPRELWGQKVEVTIPSLRIAGERFRVGFTNAAVAHAEEGIPAALGAEDEKKLYLTPGGKYTEADIEANGNMTASRKFKGMMASHDLKPKPGDKICPITLTKANPKFTWIVGGKAYEFCCPPCVDEFVAQAKDQQTVNEIKEPEHYIKKTAQVP